MPENIEAWKIWTEYPDQILHLEGGGMAGAIFTLNLVSLNCLMELTEIHDKVSTYRKIRTIFNVWKELQDAKDRVKGKQSEERTKRMRREIGGNRA